jgi:hypothetical protein
VPRPSRHHYDQRLPASGRPLAVVVALVALATMTGCAGGGKLDEDGAAGPARPGTPTAGPTTAEWPVAGVAPVAARFADDPAVRGFIRYRNARFTALTTLDQNDPELAATATGLQLSHDRQVISERRQKGYRLQGRPRWSIVGLHQVAAARAEVDACEWDSASRVVDRNGAVVVPVSDRWLPVRSTLSQEGKGWAVSESVDGTFTCKDAR